MINWTMTRKDMELLMAIISRAERMGLVKDRMQTVMDLSACHSNGTPLRLVDLLAAEDGDFIHDITGIGAHMDRGTGQLKDCFLPRFAKHEEHKGDGDA